MNCFPYGIHKDNSSKTHVDIPANTRETIFVIAGPQNDQWDPNGDNTCGAGTYPYPCCWATLTTAAVCQLNPSYSEHANNQATTAHIPLSVTANVTMLIDNAFLSNMEYIQPFFPLYYGYEVYDGYLADLDLSCKDFHFY